MLNLRKSNSKTQHRGSTTDNDTCDQPRSTTLLDWQQLQNWLWLRLTKTDIQQLLTETAGGTECTHITLVMVYTMVQRRGADGVAGEAMRCYYKQSYAPRAVIITEQRVAARHTSPRIRQDFKRCTKILGSWEEIKYYIINVNMNVIAFYQTYRRTNLHILGHPIVNEEHGRYKRNQVWNLNFLFTFRFWRFLRTFNLEIASNIPVIQSHFVLEMP